MKDGPDSREEHKEAPDPPYVFEVYEHVKGLEVTFGNIQRQLYQVGRHSVREWACFRIAVLKGASVKHNEDAMHVWKDVCDMLLWTLLDVNRKKKGHIWLLDVILCEWKYERASFYT